MPWLLILVSALFSASVQAAFCDVGDTAYRDFNPRLVLSHSEIPYFVAFDTSGSVAQLRVYRFDESNVLEVVDSTIPLFWPNTDDNIDLLADNVSLQRLRLQDMDADGDEDLLLFMGSYLQVYRHGEPEVFSLVSSIPVSGDTPAPTTFSADAGFLQANADQQPDIWVAHEQGLTVLINDGSNGFAQRLDVATGSYQSAAAGDINGDGYDDLLAMSGTKFEVWENTGQNGFALTRSSAISDPRVAQVEIVDVSGDQRQDVLIIDTPTQLYLQHENGELASTPQQFDSPNGLFALDMDADGDVDLLPRQRSADCGGPQSFAAWRNDGQGQFDDNALNPLFDNDYALVDVSGDGLPEIFTGLNYALNTWSLDLEIGLANVNLSTDGKRVSYEFVVARDRPLPVGADLLIQLEVPANANVQFSPNVSEQACADSPAEADTELLCVALAPTRINSENIDAFYIVADFAAMQDVALQVDLLPLSANLDINPDNNHLSFNTILNRSEDDSSSSKGGVLAVQPGWYLLALLLLRAVGRRRAAA